MPNNYTDVTLLLAEVQNYEMRALTTPHIHMKIALYTEANNHAQGVMMEMERILASIRQDRANLLAQLQVEMREHKEAG